MLQEMGDSLHHGHERIYTLKGVYSTKYHILLLFFLLYYTITVDMAVTPVDDIQSDKLSCIFWSHVKLSDLVMTDQAR